LWFLLHDNAWPHAAHVARETLADISATPVEHPPDIPDLTCDFWAFPMLKHEIQGQKFSTNIEVKVATTTVLSKMSGNGLLHVFEMWVGHY
jgi:hypothetical protein